MLLSNQKAIKNAASLIITCLSPMQSAKELYDFKLMYCKRSSKMKVAPNFHVFPGGKIDDLLDQSHDWFKLFLNKTNQHENLRDNKLITNKFKRLIRSNSLGNIIDNRRENNNSRVELPLEISFRLCAIRETFEETGVLLALQREKNHLAHDYQFAPKQKASVYESEVIHEWHDIIRKDPNQFINMFFELNLLPDVFALHEWANWITPPHEKARFNTIFFTCFLSHVPTRVNINRDEIENIEVSLNNYSNHIKKFQLTWKTKVKCYLFSELIKSFVCKFLSPNETLDKYDRREIKFIPPQLYETMRISKVTRFEDLSQYSLHRQNDGIKPWLPMFTNDLKIGLLPGKDTDCLFIKQFFN